MQEAEKLVDHIVSQITGDPSCFRLTSSIDERGVLLSLAVDEEQAGRVIGKGGQTAMGIRAILKALGIKNNAYYSMKITVFDGVCETP